MHAQLSKEWRLLRPGLVAAIGLALLPLVVPVDAHSREDTSYLLTFGMFLGGVLLGIETFGREFHQQTSTLWLALPMSRAGLWRSKLTMVGLALAGVILVHWLALLAGWPLRGLPPNYVELARPVVAIVGGAVLGVCWSLLLRQTWAAFWMSLIVPGALMLLIHWLVVLFRPIPEDDLPAGGPDVGGMFALGFCLVGVIGFFIARRRFDRLEDLGPVGEDVQLKAPRFLQSFLRADARSERRTASAGRSLWWKEIRLQQMNLALAAGFALVLLFVHLLRHAALAMSDRFSPHDLEFVDFLWALWSLLPLTIGLATVAEERRLGVESWQETLPVSRARRWWIKIGAAYAVAFGIGVIVPVMGGTIAQAGPLPGMLMYYALAWLIMTTVGLYVSSLARNLVQAVSILVPFAVGLGLAWAGGLSLTRALGPQPADWYSRIPVGLHFMAVTGALLFLALLWLAWRNSAPGRGEGLALRLNLSLLAAVWVAGVLLVSGTRARVWEWFRPEPAPMSALTALPGVDPNVIVSHVRVTVLTPDGNLWVYGFDQSLLASESRGDAAPPTARRRLDENHRWLNVGAAENRICAVRSDGTLWQWGMGIEPDPDRPGRVRRSGMNWISPTQVGVDTDWQSVATAWGYAVALKRDGTLWGWGSNGNGQLGQPETEFVEAPVKISGATNWTLVTVGPGNSLAANSDGEVWEWGWVGQPPRGPDKEARRLGVPSRIASDIQWQSLLSTAGENLGVSNLGEVWILRQWSWIAPPNQVFPVRWQGDSARDTVLGSGFAWSIDDRGRLLRWSADRSKPYHGYDVPIVHESRRMGVRTDWLDLGGAFGGHSCFGLTADGGLWAWGVPFDRQAVWLPPSQRPRRVALLRADDE